MSIKFRELICLCKKKQKVRSNKTSFSINSCSIEFSKTELFPWLTLRKQLFFLFMLCFGILIFRLVGKNCVNSNLLLYFQIWNLYLISLRVNIVFSAENCYLQFVTFWDSDHQFYRGRLSTLSIWNW